MSSISAGTTTGAALVHTADTTGSLVLKTGSSATTALTLDTSQVALFAGAAYNATVTLTDGATISWDTAAAPVAKVTLGGNRTMAAPTNLKDGAFYSLYIIQDATGSRTLSWNSVDRKSTRLNSSH